MLVSYSTLTPFFRALKTVLGPEAAGSTRVSVAGSLMLELITFVRRSIKISDIDIFVDGPTKGFLNPRVQLRTFIAEVDKCLIVNLEGVCGVTYRDDKSKLITGIDIISPEVTGFAPEGIILSEIQEDALTEDNLPLVSAEEIVKMKPLSAPVRDDGNKALRDLDDVKELVSKLGLAMTYKNEEEKATMEAALDEFLPTYPEKEKEWTKEEWKKKLAFA